MTQHPQLDFSVAYCTLKGAQAAFDPEFNTMVQWDIPLLNGYSWQEVPNRGSGGNSFLGLFNPELWKLIRGGKFDAVLCYLGYRCLSFWITYFACRRSGSAFIFGTDASSLVPRSGGHWKVLAKKAFWPGLFSLADQVIAASNATGDLMRSLGIPPERITLTPDTVDNDWWMAESRKVDRVAIRASWGAEPQTRVILFCGKLQPWKRPQDVIKAFAEAKVADGLLLFAGEGGQRAELERQVCAHGLGERVRFVGFVNQSQLPGFYTGADLMVVPSEYEPFALVVNEAFCCGCPVIASDHVGAVRDLIAPIDPKLVFPCGNSAVLAKLLGDLCQDPERLRELGHAARNRIADWSHQDNVKGTVSAVKAAVSRRKQERQPGTFT